MSKKHPLLKHHGLKHLMSSGAVLSLALLTSFQASAQTSDVTIDEDQSEQVRTSTAGAGGAPANVTIASGTTITPTTAGPAAVLDSANSLTHAGAITIEDTDNAVGVELQGGADRSYTQTGSINIIEDYTPTDTDDDPFVDGPVAEGTGRTGILISGASPFAGDINIASGASINVEGNDSFGINLANTPMMTGGLTGNMTTEGAIAVTGDNSVGVNVASNVTGDLTNNGAIIVSGEGSTAYNIAADVQGGFATSGQISSNGFRFPSRVGFSSTGTSRGDLGAEDLREAGSAISISGNVSEGVFLQRRLVANLDADGNEQFDDDGNLITTVASTSAITQTGSAPAVLLDGNGSLISIGLVAAITNPNDADYDADLQYSFINQGTVTASGLYDDFDATALSITDTNLTNGLSNTGNMSASTFRSPTVLDEIRGTGLARVIVLGDQAIANQINNTGFIVATASEAGDEIYADIDNPIAPRDVNAIAIDIGANATTDTLTNAGIISALLVGREGQAVAIQDASGTLRAINNQGQITALGSTSDPNNLSDIDFTLIAINASQNTLGFTLTQSQLPDEDPDDNLVPAAPNILGSVLLGSGDDTITASAGLISGENIDFGAGNDTLALSGGARLRGNVTNSGGLDISVIEGSSLTLTEGTPLAVTNASFDDTSTFSPTIDGATGTASTLTATGNVTFSAGAAVSPILNNIVGVQSQTYNIATAANLTIGDLANLSSGETPFLYRTNFAISPTDPNTLVVTLDLRDPTLSIADGGLGLDGVQQAAFGATFENLTATQELGNAVANTTTAGGFYAAYNQLLPEFAAAARQFVIANVDGATGAIGNHLDNVRRSPEKPGGAWMQEYAYFADRELAGLSEQYRGAGFGFTGGLDTAFGPFHALGVNFGISSTEIEDVVGIDDPLDVVTIQGGIYGGIQSGGLGIEAYAGGGYNKFEQERQVRINEFFGTSKGDWKGTHINGSVRAGYDVELSKKFWLRPTLSVDYLRLTEDAYEEDGDAGIAIGVDKRTSESASVAGIINLGAKFQGKRTWIRPSIRAGYKYEFLNDPVLTSYRYIGLDDGTGGLFDSQRANLESVLFPDSGILVGFSVAAGSAYSSIGFDFDSDIRDGFIRHTGRIVVRLLF